MTEPEPMYQILSLYQGRRLYDIKVPFICRRCGRCCRQLGVRTSSLDVEAIAAHLGLAPEEVARRYLDGATAPGGDQGRYGWMARSSPCPFLSPQAECSIYPVRPSGCRSYPLYTLLGPEGVDCPGMALVQRMVSVMGRGIPYEFHHLGGEEGEAPGPAQARRIVDKLRRNGVPEDAVRALASLNGWGAVTEGETRRGRAPEASSKPPAP